MAPHVSEKNLSMENLTVIKTHEFVLIFATRVSVHAQVTKSSLNNSCPGTLSSLNHY